MDNMDKIINEDILNHLSLYFDMIYKSKLELEIDGVKGFNIKSQFVEGKVVNACSCVYESMTPDSDKKIETGKKLTEIIDLMADRVYETWGILNCISALNRLKNRGLLDQIISKKALDLFIQKLDWRTFVNTDDLTLIDKPTNYYGVAFGIAKYRELLGFEPEGWSEKLLNKLLTHVDNFSGEFSFMDETNGHGRFDRYSILIPGEICSLLYDTGCDIPKKLLGMLRKSCSIFLQLTNNEGKGFSYGRSIGAYGDSATMEVLSIGALLGVLNPDEIDIAYSYCCKTINRFVTFWIDKETKSLNMWDKGRRTDDYRNKNRILGENLSLSMQFIHGYEYWEKLGYSNKEPMENFNNLNSLLPNYSKFKFAEGDYSRSLYIIRDDNHVITLPLINGSDKYYNQSPYLPIPNEFDVFTTTANSIHPNLIPKLIFNDGKEVMPIVYIKDIKDNLEAVEKGGLELEYRLPLLALIGENIPKPFPGVSAKVEYKFNKGVINFKIRFNFNEIDISTLNRVEMEFANFSKIPTIDKNRVSFNNGSIKNIMVSGLELREVLQNIKDPEYSTPVGQLTSIIKYSLDSAPMDKDYIDIEWEINYN